MTISNGISQSGIQICSKDISTSFYLFKGSKNIEKFSKNYNHNCYPQQRKSGKLDKYLALYIHSKLSKGQLSRDLKGSNHFGVELSANQPCLRSSLGSTSSLLCNSLLQSSEFEQSSQKSCPEKAQQKICPFSPANHLKVIRKSSKSHLKFI